MGLRGPKPQGKVRTKWSSEFAYAVGLLVTDGSVSKNGRHIVLVSKDIDQLRNFMKALRISVPISYSYSGYSQRKIPRLQFSDALFVAFLLEIGIAPNKTKTIGEIRVPKKYFFDFLRGHLDGDGSVYSYQDPRWKSSHVCYTQFVSASPAHIAWLQSEIRKQLQIVGHISKSQRSSVYQLRYGKRESTKLWQKLYYPQALCLRRKRLKVEKISRIIAEQE